MDIFDVVVETDEGGTVTHCTVAAGVIMRGAFYRSTLDGAIHTVLSEVEFLLTDLPVGRIVRVYDMKNRDYMDFVKE